MECRGTSEWLPIQQLCHDSSLDAINRIIDIYIERNLDLECVMSDGWTLLHLLCAHKGPEQPIKRMTLLYIDRKYNLEREITKKRFDALIFVCRNKSMCTIKFMIDMYIQQKIFSKKAYRKSSALLERHMNANPLLNGKRVMHMYLNSLEMEVFV